MKKIPDLFLIAFLMGASLMISFKNRNEEIAQSNKSTGKIKTPLLPDSLFRSGDIIFRDGRGVISSAFRRLSLTDPRYSHAGIIHKENGLVFVYHILGGERGRNNKMRKDLLSFFCNPLQSNSFAVYRMDQNGKKIDSLATHYFSKKLEFDTGFNLSTDDKMYCTELIYKILIKVSGQENYLPLTNFSGVKYEACDNIYLSSHSKKIYSFNYSY